MPVTHRSDEETEVMQISESLIRDVVQNVLAQVGTPAPVAAKGYERRHGVFQCPDEAVAAAREAFEQLSARTIEDRKRIIDHIRRISIDQCVELGTMEMNETQIGRLDHKIAKLKTLGERSPGVEFMRSEVFSGDHGIAVIEHAPFGVIGAITPVTHSLPTITGNAVSMIASGNTVVVIEHNLDVIKTADYIVDMGPEGGVKGGNIVAEGKPEEVCKVKESYTGQFLKPLLA